MSATASRSYERTTLPVGRLAAAVRAFADRFAPADLLFIDVTRSDALPDGTYEERHGGAELLETVCTLGQLSHGPVLITCTGVESRRIVHFTLMLDPYARRRESWTLVATAPSRDTVARLFEHLEQALGLTPATTKSGTDNGSDRPAGSGSQSSTPWLLGMIGRLPSNAVVWGAVIVFTAVAIGVVRCCSHS